MRISTIALTTLTIGSVLSAAFTYFTEAEKPVYQPRKSMAFEEAVGRHDIAIEFERLLKGDPKTGKIEAKAILASRASVRAAKARKAEPMGLIFTGLGPDNIGGRTRALVIDKDNPNILLTGGVSGGVYLSFDGAQTWQPKLGGTSHLISTIAQAANGYFYIGTGPGHDNYGGAGGGSSNGSDNIFGDGLYRLKDIWSQHEHLIDVEVDGQGWSRINQIVAHPTNPDIIFVATGGNGLQVSKDASSADPTFTQVNGITGASIADVDISPDGNTVIATTNGRVWRSTDGGDNFVLVLDNTGSRIECDIAPGNGNYVYISAAQGNSCLHSIQQSTDGGATWHIIAESDGSGNNATFDPFANPGVNCQGEYDNAIAVFPNDPTRILVGGVQMWEGKQQPGSNPPAFGWTQVAITIGGPLSQAGPYLHADKHVIRILDGNTIYVGTDGGIAKSTDGGNLWTQNNRNYRVTQFYSLAILPQASLPDIVMGGTQDNGTLAIGFSGIPGTGFLGGPGDATEIGGGDGFDCEFSRLDLITFASSQNGNMFRFEGATGSAGTIWDSELESICSDDCGPFYTCLEYWETTNAEATPDSIWVVTPQGLQPGDTVTYSSAIGGALIQAIINSTVPAGDSILLPDPVQTKLAFANVPSSTGSAVYLTREAATLTVGVPEWSKIAGAESYPDPYIAQTFTMQYSADGNHLFIGTVNGVLYRVSNLLYAKDSLLSDVRSSSCVLTCTRIATMPAGGVITGIAADPNDIDNLIVTVGGYNNPNAVFRITNATQATSGGSDLTSIQGDLPTMPVFEAEIDLSNKNIVLIGTEYGVWATKNAFAGSGNSVEWTSENFGIPQIPVYEIKQQIHPIGYNFATLSPGPALNYKTYYVATHGGGFYKTESLVGVEEIKGEKEKFETSLKVYPNPVKTHSFMEFKLPSRSTARVFVYNLKGQIVQEMDLGTVQAGTQKIRLETSSLSAGTYILALRAGEFYDTAKFIKSE